MRVCVHADGEMCGEVWREAGKIEEKKREAEAAVAQSEVASKKRREGKRVRVPVRFRKPLDSSSPNYRNLTLAMERDGFAEPLVEGSYPSFEVLIYEDDLDLLDKFCGVKGLDILDHRMEELPESRSATTIVGDFSLELLLKAIRDANPGCFVTGKQVHGKTAKLNFSPLRFLLDCSLTASHEHFYCYWISSNCD
ncbi:hypothetical protein PAPYR_5875 [Paratrimastix pyriformis]|uniref:Uncharacterized protein n=1 Tax=Paratrimastix pyriformis TaxID=342808 RepID=A0ABQ8UGE7_9EUKA|nr:hypothetical protein PAPYR_5875 [Paratrimastix pyriformis]